MFSQSNFYESAPIMNLRKTLQAVTIHCNFQSTCDESNLTENRNFVNKEFPTSDMGQISSNISSH